MNNQKRDVEKARYQHRTIGETARSGTSIREFCRQRRPKESEFYWWQHKLKGDRQERMPKLGGQRGEARRVPRQAQAKPIQNDIGAYLEQPHVLPKSPEGQAIAYTLSNWKALIRYCEDGNLEIDNNGAERSLRGIAVGRRNWMFYGSDNGGRTAAALTSLIATCKHLGMDPLAYLRDLFGRIAAHPNARIAELLPDQWKITRQPTPIS